MYIHAKLQYTLKGSCTPGSILIDNEEEEPCLFIINAVVIGTWHFKTVPRWLSGRPSLSTRVWTKILLFLFLRLAFASLMYLHPNTLMVLRMEHIYKARSLSKSVEESKKEVKSLFFDHRAGYPSTSRASFWTRLKVGERNYEHECFHSSWFLERTEQNLGNKVFNSPDLVTTWSFCCAWKWSSYIFCEVCEIYKPNLSDFKHNLCNFHEPFLSCALTCVLCFHPFLSISGCSAHRCGIDSVALYSQLVSSSFISPCPWSRGR